MSSQLTRAMMGGTGRQLARRGQRGAALVIGLILLLVLTLLAVAGMNSATTELVMAGNEQFHRSAAHAASAGIEEAIAGIGTVPTTAGASPVQVVATPVPGAETSGASSACGPGSKASCY